MLGGQSERINETIDLFLLFHSEGFGPFEVVVFSLLHLRKLHLFLVPDPILHPRSPLSVGVDALGGKQIFLSIYLLLMMRLLMGTLLKELGEEAFFDGLTNLRFWVHFVFI